jgi:hypothetical protein
MSFFSGGGRRVSSFAELMSRNKWLTRKAFKFFKSPSLYL